MTTQHEHPLQAAWDWNIVCQVPMGLDSDGNELSAPTPLGIFVQGAGVPSCIDTSAPSGVLNDQGRRVARFLRQWADRLEGRPTPIEFTQRIDELPKRAAGAA